MWLFPRNSEDPHNAATRALRFRKRTSRLPQHVLRPAPNYRSQFGIPSCLNNRRNGSRFVICRSEKNVRMYTPVRIHYRMDLHFAICRKSAYC